MRTVEDEAEFMRKAFTDVGLDPSWVAIGDIGHGTEVLVTSCGAEDLATRRLIHRAYALVGNPGHVECFQCWSLSTAAKQITCANHSM